MDIEILLFGIVADLIGENSIQFHLEEESTVSDFKKQLVLNYPQLKSYTTFAIAVNEEYALDDKKIKHQDIIAIIPPVSGG